MRVAALYDIHGNLPALEAVLDQVDRLGPDRILIGGDVVFGPMPCGVLDLLRARGDRVTFVRGNADREVAHALDRDADDPGKKWHGQSRWVAQQLNPEQRAWLGGLPTTTTIEIDGLGPTLFCHGSPRSDEEIITRLSSEDRLREILRDVGPSTVVCGHTHVQFDRNVLGKRLVNAGSVGLPYEDSRGARWAMFGPDVELKRTPYDLDRAVEQLRRSEFPDVVNFLQRMLVEPMGPAAASEKFEGMAIESDAEARART